MQRCPLNSPARGELVSLILALMWECPVFHIKGTPPASRMISGKYRLHFTSKITVSLGLRRQMSSAKNIISLSGQMMSPAGVTTPSRSPSPSKAKPMSALVSLTMAIRSCRFSGSAGSGWWLGKFPSTSQNSGVTLQPKASMISGAMPPATPFPQSTTTFNRRLSSQTGSILSRKAGTMSAVEIWPLPSLRVLCCKLCKSV